MKKNFKKIFCVGLMLACCLSFIILNKNISLAEEKHELLVVCGQATMEAEPDTLELNFGIRVRAESIKEGQEKINAIYEKIENSIKQEDSNNKTYITYSSCYPTCDSSILSYDLTYNFCVKTKNIEKVDEIISLAYENGVTNCYSKNYILENKQEVYANALKSAREDAIAKAKAISNDAKLSALMETSLYSYSQGEKGSKIIIEANVKGVFVTNGENLSNTFGSMNYEDKDLGNKTDKSKFLSFLLNDSFENLINNDGIALLNEEDKLLQPRRISGAEYVTDYDQVVISECEKAQIETCENCNLLTGDQEEEFVTRDDETNGKFIAFEKESDLNDSNDIKKGDFFAEEVEEELEHHYGHIPMEQNQ